MKVELSKVQNFLEWMKIKLYLDTISSNAQKRTVKRGQVYWCNLGVGIGSEMQKKRPCVIVQNDIANMKSPNVIIIPITHDNSILPCMAAIDEQKDADGITIIDGQANTSNILCVSKARLGDYICDLSNEDMKRVDGAVAKSIGIMHYYSSSEKKLKDKLVYIEKLKSDRNQAQDTLADIRKLIESNVGTDNLLEKIKNML